MASGSGAGRKLNVLEQKLHQSALAESKKTLTQAQIELLAPDIASRTEALNFLLGTGLFKVLKDAKGTIVFRAVAKKEVEIKKDLSGEENMVLSHIQASSTEGIWTKHLKAKTELHQTVIDRCLKSLVQRQLVKSVKSVKHPTRKIYMLAHLDPSVEVTGGPWYTDNELDTEFIKLLSSACLKFIRDRSFPKSRSKSSASADARPLYSISSSPPYPSAHQIQLFLSKSKITETQLTVEHVDMLLNVLCLDGEIEKIPSYGAAMWDSHVPDEDDDSDGRKKRKKKKRKRSSSESETTSESENEDEEDGSKKKKKKKKSKKKEKERKKKRKQESSESESSDGDGDEDDTKPRKGKEKSKSSGSESTSRSSSPEPSGFSAPLSGSGGFGSFVYRAIHQEKVQLGWSQAPCGRCPQFDFCSPKGKGPVNPSDCVYYGQWLEVDCVNE